MACREEASSVVDAAKRRTGDGVGLVLKRPGVHTMSAIVRSAYDMTRAIDHPA
jgi:hypothetical protein